MSTLLDAVPTHTLGYPFSGTLKIIIYFFLPPIFLLAIYLTLIAVDIGLVYQHFIEENPRWASITLLLMCWPAVSAFMFTVSSPLSWPADKPFAKKNLIFFGVQLWYFLCFPLAVTYRYIYSFFWAIEALIAHLKTQDERRESALSFLMEPSPLELYFFLQAYLHCVPQILLQFYILLRTERFHSDTASIQLLSVAASLLRMAITTTSYQRFERRKILGVRYPWLEQNKTFSTKYTEIPPNNIVKAPLEEISNFVGLPLDLPREHSSDLHSKVNWDSDSGDDEVFDKSESFISTKQAFSTGDATIDEESLSIVSQDREKNANEIEFDNDVLLEHQIPEENKPTVPNENIEKRRLRVSIIENPDIEIRRGNRDSKIYNIVDMSKHTTPPETPAPRPLSIGVIRNKIMSNAESIMDMIPRRTYKEPVDFDVPVRVRRAAIKGIEQEDGVSKFIAFISWLLFLTARMLAIVTFSYFYLNECFYICIAHYLVMVLLLLSNSWSENLNRKIFYFFLGYIYVFCIIEFKMKFRKVRLWYGLYFILVTLENLIMTAVWFWSGLWESWWFTFMGVVIVFSTMFSYICFLIYFLILKPKTMTVYPIMSSQSVFPVTIS